MISAIQVHPHDVRDEGADAVVANITELARISIMAAETATLEERHPYPDGVLTHNPVHSVVTTNATLEVPLRPEAFADLPVQPVMSDEAACGRDYIADLAEAAARRGSRKATMRWPDVPDTDQGFWQQAGVTVIPWIKALNSAFNGDIERVCVQTVEGDLAPTWLCPSRPESGDYLIRLVIAICDHYRPDALLVDRLRYPDWSGAEVVPNRLLTCFCPVCVHAMEESGINVALLKAELARLCEVDDCGLAGAKRTARKGEVGKWCRFRQDRISALAAFLQAEVRRWSRQHGHNVRLWLNLWPPAFAPWLGQDYAALCRLCDGAKFFPYHRLGGGADLAGLVKAIAKSRPGKDEKVFASLCNVLGLDYHIGFAQFCSEGLPVEFVRRETETAKAAFGSVPVFTGIQIWNLPALDIQPAVDHARAGGADGMFFYCYGWATLEALAKVGDAVQHASGRSQTWRS